MNTFVGCVFLALAGLASAAPYSYPRGCIYYNGLCIQECPIGTLGYSMDCGYVTREATCAKPHPKPDTLETCGYSACHCAHPTVRDEMSGKCVHIDKCPQVRIINTHGEPKIQHRPVAPKAPVAPEASVAPVAPVAPVEPVAPTGSVASAQAIANTQTAPETPSLPNNAHKNYKDYDGFNGYNGYNTNNVN